MQTEPPPHLDLAAAILTEGIGGPSRLHGPEVLALALVLEDYPSEVPATVTVDALRELNRRVLDGCRLTSNVIPGDLLDGRRPMLARSLRDVNLASGDPVAAAHLAEDRIRTLRPFADGNRRTARVLALALATRHTGDILAAVDVMATL